MKKRAWVAAIVVGSLVAIVHLAGANGYGLFRNELYFIVCGWHPAWGYVDQPPLVPLVAAAMWTAHQVWIERLPGIVAAVALVPLTVLFASELGATPRAAWLAAVAAAGSGLVTAMTATLTTSTFEPIGFTAVAYFVVRALRGDRRAFWWAGLASGLLFETKFGVVLWVVGLLVGIALCGPRRAFIARDAWIGAAIGSALALPTIVWQLAHGLPFLELVRNDNSGNFTGGPIGFTLAQLFLNNIVLAPLWLTGMIAPFVSRRLETARPLSVAFVVTGVLILMTHGKQYYFAGAIPTMFAVGSAACTRRPRWLVGAWAALALANAFVALPFVLPVIPPQRLADMIANSSWKMRPMERAGIGAPLMQQMSDEFGWPQVASATEAAFSALPESERSRAVVYAENYGDASAIEVYGSGLPPVISGNNNYFLWGTHGADGSVVLAVNVDPAQWASRCQTTKIVASFGTSPYAMPYEVHRPIVLCLNMRPALHAQWPSLKHFGIENLGM